MQVILGFRVLLLPSVHVYYTLKEWLIIGMQVTLRFRVLLLPSVHVYCRLKESSIIVGTQVTLGFRVLLLPSAHVYPTPKEESILRYVGYFGVQGFVATLCTCLLCITRGVYLSIIGMCILLQAWLVSSHTRMTFSSSLKDNYCATYSHSDEYFLHL